MNIGGDPQHFHGELAELRVRARLAWNNWPDTVSTRTIIAEHEARDQFSARAWDRVIATILEGLQ